MLMSLGAASSEYRAVQFFPVTLVFAQYGGAMDVGPVRFESCPGPGVMLSVAVFQAERRACPERSRRDLAWTESACREARREIPPPAERRRCSG